MEKSNLLSLEDYINDYVNNEDNNNNIYTSFTNLTDKFNYLKNHRDYIEKNDLGFGDRAFHYMWKLVLNKLDCDFKNVQALEIGVYKGQVISLWALIAKKINAQIEITAITPLKGNPSPNNKIIKKLLTIVSKKFRNNLNSGNFYKKIDYFQIIKSLFNKFQLDFNKVNFYKGLSTDNEIIEVINKKKFHLIYIDGDHSFEGVTKDITNYAELIYQGGLLVMDDSACNIPGTIYWKGHQSVSDACEIIESIGFINVLNVGHNRIYLKL